MKSKHSKSRKDKINNANINSQITSRRKTRKNKKSKRLILNVLQLVFLCLMIYSGINIFLWLKDNGASSDIINEISSIINDENNNVDFEKLKNINNEVVGVIKVNGTNIEYPVVKHSDNEFYLNHSFDKTENGAGWIFADYRDSLDGTDRNTIIYGHNRRDGKMFGTLKNVLKEEWYSNSSNLTISFKTEKEEQKYQVFSVYKIESEDYYITTDFTLKTYDEFINTLKKRSVKDFKTEVSNNDKILTLSTCDNNNKYRVVLHAVKVKE